MENKRPLTNVALPHFAEVTKVFKFVESDDGDESEKGKWEELAKGVVRFAKMTTGKTRLQLQDKSKSGTGFKLNMMIQDKTPLQLVNDRHVYVRAQRSCVHRRHTIALTSLLSTLSLPLMRSRTLPTTTQPSAHGQEFRWRTHLHRELSSPLQVREPHDPLRSVLQDCAASELRGVAEDEEASHDERRKEDRGL